MLIHEMKEIVENYCERTGSSLPEAAKVIGISRSTLYEWFRQDQENRVNRRFVRDIQKLRLD